MLAEAPWAARSYHSCMVLPESQQLLLLGGHAADDWCVDDGVACAPFLTSTTALCRS